MPLRGEYIWDGIHHISADDKVDDVGHEAATLQKISGMYAEDFFHVLSDYYNKFYAMDEDELLKNPLYQKIDEAGYDLDQLKKIANHLKNYEGGVDPDEVHEAFEILQILEPENYISPDLIEAMKVINGGDSRLYALKHFGDIIIRHNSFEVWGWNRQIANKILNGIYDIFGYQLENDPEEYEQEIDIFDHKTKKAYTMTIRQLEENPMQLSSVPPSVIQTKKGAISILDPRSRGGSQNWQQHYTSESFSTFLKKRDSELYKEYKQL